MKRIVTIHTKSHSDLAQISRSSLEKCAEAPFKISSHAVPQTCPSANYLEDGWKETVKLKYAAILDETNSMKADELFLFADADIVFFKDPFEAAFEILEANQQDIALLEDNARMPGAMPEYCTGFFAARNTPTVKALMRTVLNLTETTPGGDQRTMNDLLRGTLAPEMKYRQCVKAAPLPRETFRNPKSPGCIDDRAVLFHANWIVGAEAKKKAMIQAMARCESAVKRQGS